MGGDGVAFYSDDLWRIQPDPGSYEVYLDQQPADAIGFDLFHTGTFCIITFTTAFRFIIWFHPAAVGETPGERTIVYGR